MDIIKPKTCYVLPFYLESYAHRTHSPYTSASDGTQHDCTIVCDSVRDLARHLLAVRRKYVSLIISPKCPQQNLPSHLLEVAPQRIRDLLIRGTHLDRVDLALAEFPFHCVKRFVDVVFALLIGALRVVHLDWFGM